MSGCSPVSFAGLMNFSELLVGVSPLCSDLLSLQIEVCSKYSTIDSVVPVISLCNLDWFGLNIDFYILLLLFMSHGIFGYFLPYANCFNLM